MTEIIANEASRTLVPGWGGRISAELVWDGGDEVRVPAAMGTPRADQMQGTARERLTEVALRICYDSMGTGRSSEKCHEHILDVRHWSVHEHAAMTIEVTFGENDHAATRAANYCLNRPSMRVRRVFDHREGKPVHSLRVTCNPRHLNEWKTGYDGGPGYMPAMALGEVMRRVALPLAPRILCASDLVGHYSKHDPQSDYVTPSSSQLRFGAEHNLLATGVSLVEPETDDEKWVTFYTAASRGCGEELIRHGDWTAFSRRSTRFVEEGKSEWVLHPLIAAFLEQTGDETDIGGELSGMADLVRSNYDELVKRLESWLISRGVDKVSARKQARGAARGVLGLALESETIVSFTVAQGLHMLRMRAANAADAEIRAQFAEAFLPGLLQSRYADRFADLELQPASDGIGRSLKGGGSK